jgi:hypothetical protein
VGLFEHCNDPSGYKNKANILTQQQLASLEGFMYVCMYICIYLFIYLFRPIPVATLPKVWVCGRALTGIVGSNPTGGMDVFLLYSVCVVKQRSLRRAAPSS